MMESKVVVCPICNKRTLLRIEDGGYLDEYPVRVNCYNCHALLKGQFVMRGAEAKLGLTMLNASVEECTFNSLSIGGKTAGINNITVQNADFVADISGELPCKYVCEYTNGLPTSPYLSIADNLPSVTDRIARLKHFTGTMSMWVKEISTPFQLLEDGSTDYVGIALKNSMGGKHYECDHYLKSLHCLQELVLEETKYLFASQNQDECIRSILLQMSYVDKGEVSNLCQAIGGNEALLQLYRKAIEIVSKFMYIYPYLLPAETYLHLKHKETVNSCLSTCSFSDIKTFYQDAYESILSLAFIPICLDNIVMRGNYQAFESIYDELNRGKGVKTLDQYMKLDNGTRFNKFNRSEQYQRSIEFEANRYLRNGIGHNNVKYDGIKQTITAFDLKDHCKVRASLQLMNIAVECIGFAKTSVIISEMILFLLRHVLREEHITTIIHPRYYNNTAPNDHCPCGSGIKYKRCCKHSFESFIAKA